MLPFACRDMNPHLVLVDDWLSDFKKLGTASASAIHHYCDRVESDSTTIAAIFKALDESQWHCEYLELVCDQLFNYYRSKEERLKTFAISFIPALIGIYLSREKTRHSIHGPKYQCVDVLLLGIYNMEVVNEDGVPMERKFRMPVLSKPSVFHEPSSHTIVSQTGSLTENALNKLDAGSTDVLISSFGPYSEYEVLCASTRPIILTVLMKIYNCHLSSVSKESLRSVCQMCTKSIAAPHQLNSDVCSDNNLPTELNIMELMSKVSPKLHLPEGFLVELAYSIYFCLYNDVVLEGRKALERIHSVALYHLYPDVLLMTNSMRSSMKLNLSYQESQESAADINLSALSPTSVCSAQIGTGILKTAITNASFKTRKLPEDIPIIAVNAAPNLMSIDEAEESPVEAKTSQKTGGKSQGQTPPGKMILNLLQKKDKKKDRDQNLRSKIRSENGEVGRVMREDGPDVDVNSVSSGISDSKSCGSDPEMIPMTHVRNSVLSSAKYVADDRQTSDLSEDDGNSSVPLMEQGSPSRADATSNRSSFRSES